MMPYVPLHLRNINYQDFVTVVVGADAVEFSVHKDILCAVSPFFDAALNGEWLESGQKTVKIPETDPVTSPETFSLFLHWAYIGTIAVPAHNETDSAQVALAQLYALAEVLCASKLKNDLVDKFDGFDDFCQISAARIVFGNTSHGSRFREYIVDEFVHYASDETWLGIDEYGIAEMKDKVFDLVGTMRGKVVVRDQLPKEKQGKCYYHEHNVWAPSCEEDTPPPKT